MKKKALILDLDNTIYPVSSIGEALFKSLFELIKQSGEYFGDFKEIKQEIMRTPFQKVAADFKFSSQLTAAGTELLQDLTYDEPMFAFEDYTEIKNIPCTKFLVTTGFIKLQRSKVEQLGIEKDFAEIHIVDPRTSNKTKKDIFQDILNRYNYNQADVLVVGDDRNSEIKAATELGIDTVLYDKLNFNPDITSPNKISDFRQLKDFV
ncbi:hypothetical protein AAE02nite_05210 [Adhaeribacter aerolatus]|uniref:Uncharacterized protein n=1 Tax=Adhaeribacter aerolatus TaxID=670289 RepID=A0A512ATE1_9BACT|nr:HAD family hydrolase [Adhaeribacter aerolatus]GEO02857.1 hypothetical protein AAE02nite_05210 [Adhaeribacter aerolatus]